MKTAFPSAADERCILPLKSQLKNVGTSDSGYRAGMLVERSSEGKPCIFRPSIEKQNDEAKKKKKLKSHLFFVCPMLCILEKLKLIKIQQLDWVL